MRKSTGAKLRFGTPDILGWRFSLLDDAGSRTVVDSDAMRRAYRRTSPLRDRLRIPRQEIAHSFSSFLVYMGVSVVLLVFFVQNTPNTGFPKVLEAIIKGGITAAAMCAAFAFLAARFRHRSNGYIALMKARALCPACIHSLEGLPVPDSGLVTCPECGVQWRFDHSTAPPPPL